MVGKDEQCGGESGISGCRLSFLTGHHVATSTSVSHKDASHQSFFATFAKLAGTADNLVSLPSCSTACVCEVGEKSCRQRTFVGANHKLKREQEVRLRRDMCNQRWLASYL